MALDLSYRQGDMGISYILRVCPKNIHTTTLTLSPYSTEKTDQTRIKSTQKKRNVHGQRGNFAIGTHATYIPLTCIGSLALGVTQISAFLDTNMLV